jgi:demethylmenaquinone methyltransferase/2-methoxy-6-polyprenyl-1,4-benzoquinol methylase
LPPSPPPLSPRELAALDLDAHLADPARKQAFVTPMFEHIAPRYDDFTRVFSFGMDARWKAELLRWIDRAAPVECDLLDVACGTGDLAVAAAALRPRGRVLGVDAAAGMIERARARIEAGDRSRLAFQVGDLTRLTLPDQSIDVVTGGYAIRNVPDHRGAIAELARVLRPGGHLFTLDFYLPERALWRALFLPYLQLSGSLVGWWWHRAPVMYAYIAHSIRHFVTQEEFSRALTEHGFDLVESRTHLLGAIALHHAIRR